MSQPASGYQRFLAELKRRKVFRVTLVYGATAFVVAQVADLAFVRLGLPAWTVTLVIALAVLGFPIALVLAWAFEVTPDGVRRTEEASPEQIDQIVAEPARNRWPSGLLALAGVALLVGGAWWVGRRSGTSPGAGSETAGASIAVLPFVDMSPAGDQEYFSDGISEELLNLLARVRDLRVAARTSSFAFEDRNLAVPAIADSLGVAHVLEGSVRKAGDEVRITAQLIRAEDGYHVWSRTWDRTLDDIFQIQDEIAADVVDELRVTLLGEAPTVEETDPDAYALVLQARHLSDQGGAEKLARAEKLFREALGIDSTFAAGWAGLAMNHIRRGRNAGSLELTARAREAAERALDLDPGSARARAALGYIANLEGDLTEAARHYERALDLAPGDAWVMGRAGTMLVSLGRPEEAIRVLEYQVARDPVSVAGHLNLGLAYLAARRWSEAVRSLRTGVELGPDVVGGRAFLGTALLYAGEPEAALATIRQEPGELFRLYAEAKAYHALGQGDASDAALAEMIERYEREAAVQIAEVLAYRDEDDRAFDWLDRAAEYEDPGLSEILLWPAFERLHDDPRWPAFLERVGKAPEELDDIEFEMVLPGSAAPVTEDG